MVLIRALLRALVGPAITLAGLFAVVPVAMNGRLQSLKFLDRDRLTSVWNNAAECFYLKPRISPWDIDPDYVLVQEVIESAEEWSQHYDYVQRAAPGIGPMAVHEMLDIVVMPPAITCRYDTELPIRAIDKIVNGTLAGTPSRNVSSVGDASPVASLGETTNGSSTPSSSSDEHHKLSHTGIEDNSTQDRVNPTTLPSSTPLDYDVISVSFVVLRQAKQPRDEFMDSIFKFLSDRDVKTTSACVLGLAIVATATLYFAKNGVRVLTLHLVARNQTVEQDTQDGTSVPVSQESNSDSSSSGPVSGSNSGYVRPSSPESSAGHPSNVALVRRSVPRRAAPAAPSAEPLPLVRTPYHVPGLPGALFEDPPVVVADEGSQISVTFYNPISFLFPLPAKPYFPLPPQITVCEEVKDA